MANNKIGITVSRTDMNKIISKLNKTPKEVEEHLIYRLSYIGEEAVTIARERGSYGDVTGNLRSSIGYVVLKDGKVVVGGKSVRYPTKKGNGELGVKAAKELLQKLQAKHASGLVLIVCAAMKYAVYVEAVHHKDVLTSAKLIAESLAKELCNQLGIKWR